MTHGPCRPVFVLLTGALAGTVLPVAAPADEKPKLPLAPRFPFTEEQAKAFQDEYAKAAGLPKEITNSVGMKLILIPPGSFEMGPNGSKYRVTLTKPFYAGTTEVTLGQYRKFKSGHKVE